MTKLSDIGRAPFHFVAWDDRDFFILDEDAYAPRGVVDRLPRAGGKPRELAWFKVTAAAEEGTGINDIAVDGQCIYLAREHPDKDYSEVLALPKR